MSKVIVRFYDEQNNLIHEDLADHFKPRKIKIMSPEFRSFLQLFVGKYVSFNEERDLIVAFADDLPSLIEKSRWHDGDQVYQFIKES